MRDRLLGVPIGDVVAVRADGDWASVDRGTLRFTDDDLVEFRTTYYGSRSAPKTKKYVFRLDAIVGVEAFND